MPSWHRGRDWTRMPPKLAEVQSHLHLQYLGFWMPSLMKVRAWLYRHFDSQGRPHCRLCSCPLSKR